MGEPQPTFDNVDDVLAHFGVKGMKWGTRKASSSGSSHATSDDAKSADAAANKIKSGGGTKALSNKELQDLVKRMQLEQQYSDLTGKKGSSNKSKAAAKFMGDFLVNFGKQEAGKILSAIVAKQLKGKIPGLK